MFTVLDRISWPGLTDKPNEDECGASGDWAWVIDTSIFPGTPALMHEGSDATWLARFMSRRLSDLAPQAEDGVVLIRSVMEEARVAFMAKAPEERQDFLTWPVGAMTLVRHRAGNLDVWTFADTTAFVRQPDGSMLTVGEAPGMRQFEVAAAERLLQASGATPSTINAMPEFQAWLAERRLRQKQSKGLALLGLDPTAADRLRHQTVPCDQGAVILLTTDGFSALVDLYGVMDARQLMDEALTSGLEPLARRARKIETELDPDGKLYPRFKVSDDATAILLRV
jgi:Protein phosphatase 2C